MHLCIDLGSGITHMENILSFLLVALILLAIFAGAFIVIKKRWINKRPSIGGVQLTSQNIYLQYQNQEKQKSIEHVLNQKEEKKQDNDGDDWDRFSDPEAEE